MKCSTILKTFLTTSALCSSLAIAQEAPRQYDPGRAMRQWEEYVAWSRQEAVRRPIIERELARRHEQELTDALARAASAISALQKRRALDPGGLHVRELKELKLAVKQLRKCE